MQQITSLNPRVERTTLPVPTIAYEFIAAPLGNSTRRALEAFVTEGYAKQYHAEIHSFMPILFAIKANRLRAVIGVRRATQALFIEQYLPVPITSALEKHGIWTQRSRIAELGNLYSQSQRFTLPLILTVVMGLYLSDVSYLVFAGTEKVRQLLTKLNLPMTFLADADPKLIKDDTTQWGSYYDHHPKVMFLDVKKAVAIALQQPELASILELVQANFQALLEELRSA